MHGWRSRITPASSRSDGGHCGEDGGAIRNSQSGSQVVPKPMVIAIIFSSWPLISPACCGIRWRLSEVSCSTTASLFLCPRTISTDAAGSTAFLPAPFALTGVHHRRHLLRPLFIRCLITGGSLVCLLFSTRNPPYRHPTHIEIARSRHGDRASGIFLLSRQPVQGQKPLIHTLTGQIGRDRLQTQM